MREAAHHRTDEHQQSYIDSFADDSVDSNQAEASDLAPFQHSAVTHRYAVTDVDGRAEFARSTNVSTILDVGVLANRD